MKFYAFVITLQATAFAMNSIPYGFRKLRDSLYNERQRHNFGNEVEAVQQLHNTSDKDHGVQRHNVTADDEGVHNHNVLNKDVGFRRLSLQNDLSILSKMLSKTKAANKKTYGEMVKEKYSTFSESEIKNLLLYFGK
jgi:hypothetical protein